MSIKSTSFSLYATHTYVASSTRCKPLSEMERNRSIELDSPNVPTYEISDSESQVCWYGKDDSEPLSNSGLNIQRDGNVRKLTVEPSELSDTGPFICGSLDDAVSFKMDSQGDFPETPKLKHKRNLFYYKLAIY